MKRVVVALGLASIVLSGIGSFRADAASDVVRTIKGTIQIGRVTKDDRTGIELSIPNQGKLRFTPEEIESIKWDIAAVEWRDAMAAVKGNDYLGAAQMLATSGEHPATLRDRVTSPGGTTIAGLHALERASLRAALMDAVEAAARRSEELGAG